MEKESKAKFFDKNFVPKTVEELYCSGWKEYLLYHIRRYNLNDATHSPEDILQDMIVDMIRYNFLERYDPERTEFIRYIKIFVRNFMSKVYAKENRNPTGKSIINAASLVNESLSEIEYDSNVVSYDSVGATENFDDYVCLMESMENDLKEIKATSMVQYNGMEIKRDPYTLYRLLLAGYDVKEIAEIFGTSRQFVYGLRKKIYEQVVV